MLGELELCAGSFNKLFKFYIKIKNMDIKQSEL